MVLSRILIQSLAESVFGVNSSHFTQFLPIAATENQVHGGEAHITSGIKGTSSILKSSMSFDKFIFSN
jgi:hypothetical protein